MPVKHQAQTSSSHLALSRGLNYHSLTSVCSLFKIILFIYLFLAMLVPRCCADSARVAASGGYSLAEMCWLLIVVVSFLEPRLQGTRASVVVVPRFPGSIAVAHGLSCSVGCGNLPKSGIELVSPALASRFFTTEPPSGSRPLPADHPSLLIRAGKEKGNRS